MLPIFSLPILETQLSLTTGTFTGSPLGGQVVSTAFVGSCACAAGAAAIVRPTIRPPTSTPTAANRHHIPGECIRIDRFLIAPLL